MRKVNIHEHVDEKQPVFMRVSALRMGAGGQMRRDGMGEGGGIATTHILCTALKLRSNIKK